MKWTELTAYNKTFAMYNITGSQKFGQKKMTVRIIAKLQEVLLIISFVQPQLFRESFVGFNDNI